MAVTLVLTRFGLDSHFFLTSSLLLLAWLWEMRRFVLHAVGAACVHLAASTLLAQTPFEATDGSVYPQVDRRIGVLIHQLKNRPKAESLLGWKSFGQNLSENWTVLWDPETGSPRLMYGEGVELWPLEKKPNEQQIVDAARTFLETNQGLFGLQNEVGLIDGRIRSLPTDKKESRLWMVDFGQQHHGIPVRGSKISLRFHNDKLVQIQSHTYPAVPCEDWCPVAGFSAEQSQRVLFPIRHGRGQYEYRLAERETVQVGAFPWVVYKDVRTGEILEQYVNVYHFKGKVTGMVHKRGPVDLLGNPTPPEVKPIPNLNIQAKGKNPLQLQLLDFPTYTDASGGFTLPWGFVLESVTLVLGGKDAHAVFCPDISNIQTRLTDCRQRAIPLQAVGGEIQVHLVDEVPEGDRTNGFKRTSAAERDVLYHLNRVRRSIDPYLPPKVLEEPVIASVNNSWFVDFDGSVTTGCNAFSDGVALYFFNAGNVEFDDGMFIRCRNTANIADIIYHEFTHWMYARLLGNEHIHEDPAANEGAADILAFHLTGDPYIGIGMFEEDSIPVKGNFIRYVNEPREDGKERMYPRDIPEDREPHQESLIFSSAMWDLRKSLLAKDPKKGNEKSLSLFLRALSIAPKYTEFYDALLFVDDDDADLTTPSLHQGDIRAAFSKRCLAHPNENALECPI